MSAIGPITEAPVRVGSTPPSVASVRLGDHQAKVLGAFFLIYVAWGSNFLAIRYAIETIPPFLLMGVRSLLAGLSLYLWAAFAPTNGRRSGTGGPRRWSVSCCSSVAMGCWRGHKDACRLEWPPSAWPPCRCG